jgi:Secretion system C-terminal sorting domain
MKQNFKKVVLIMLSLMASYTSIFAQSTLEMTLDGNGNPVAGPTTSPITVTFLQDLLNANAGTAYSAYSPTLTATVSYRDQQKSTVLTGTVPATTVQGLMFGARTTQSNGPAGIQAVGSVAQIYDVFGAEIPVGPIKNGMYTSSPSAAPVPANTNYQTGNFGAGLDVESITGATGPSGPDANFGISMYSSVEPLLDANEAANGRFYYGEVVIHFNRPVKNPVIHIGGLGGSYNYQPIGGGPRLISYFTTELELVNAGLTSTFMAGNEFLNLVGNNILNDAPNPNGGSVDDGSTSFGFSNYGAASGSVRINGTVQDLVYKIYVRGANSSNFNFSKTASEITSANRDPFNGDLWYLAVSLDKPTQQVSGNVFIDRDGLNDAGGGDINKSAGVANPKTNVGGLLHANLLNAAGTTVIATVPIAGDGTYLFDNVPTGNYMVQLTTNQGVPGQPRPATTLPAGWVNTGEFGSNTPGNTPGSDGTINGLSDLVTPITVNASDIKPEINFGIERIPVSVPFSYIIPKPDGGIVLTLFGGTNNFSPLTGSDVEDQPATGTLSGKTVQITELPAAFSILRYNGVPVVTGQIIPNYNPSLLQIAFIGSTPANFAEFKYSYIDAAGKPSVPTTYRLEWFGGPLAITLTNFTAIKNNCTADLTWTTAGEINASKFEVEVSSSVSTVYNKVGSVTASAAVGGGKTYQFSYPMQPGIQYYFRLKLMDKDGAFKYSDVRTLSCEGKGVITIAPNPVIDRFSISGMENGKNTVVILSATGQQVKTQIIPQSQGYVYIQNLAAGMYSVKVISEKGNVTVGKIIKN